MISFLYTYYNQKKMMDLHLKEWVKYPEYQFIVIDDCSTEPLEIDLDNVTVYRAKKDIPWSQPAARNIGFLLAPTEWVFNSDLDHLITDEAMQEIKNIDLEKNSMYTFNRMWYTGEVDRPFSSAYLMNREKFLNCGGYDEDFCGHYGWDDSFFNEYLHYKGIIHQPLNDIYLKLYCGSKSYGDAPGDRERDTNRRLLRKKLNQMRKPNYSPARIGYEVYHIS